MRQRQTRCNWMIQDQGYLRHEVSPAFGVTKNSRKYGNSGCIRKLLHSELLTLLQALNSKQ